jgi:hypothetical protein
MLSTMAYMIALEDGEIVKLTPNGFESTGMFVLPLSGVPFPAEAVRRSGRAAANA